MTGLQLTVLFGLQIGCAELEAAASEVVWGQFNQVCSKTEHTLMPRYIHTLSSRLHVSLKPAALATSARRRSSWRVRAF